MLISPDINRGLDRLDIHISEISPSPGPAKDRFIEARVRNGKPKKIILPQISQEYGSRRAYRQIITAGLSRWR